MKIVRALAILFFLTAPAQAETPLFPDLKTARAAAQAGDHESAVAHWRRLADFGIPEAQFELATRYANGNGVAQDKTEAERLMTRAADAGLPRAYLPLGRLHEDGGNHKQAQYYYTRAIDSGDARGAYHLGRLYERHADVVPAAAPLAPTPHILKKAIEAGQLSYAEELANRYAAGKRVKEREAALMYMIVAVRNGSSTATQRIDALKKGLNDKSIARAEKEADALIQRIRAPGFAEADGRAKFRQAGAMQERLSGLTSVALPDDDGNFSAAADQYKTAINQGYLRAARELGRLYEKGRGVPEDTVQALTYYYVAQDSGTESAATLRAALETGLDPRTIAKARSDADTILAAHPKPPPADQSPLRIVGVAKTIATAEENRDLGTRSDTMENALAADARVGVYYTPADDVRLYGEVRGYKSTGVIATRDDDNDDAMSAGFVEMRQFWAEFYNLFDTPILSAKIGRQRFRDDRGLWWNDDLDAGRLSLDSTLTSGFIAAGQSLDNYRLGEDDEFRADDEGRLRVLGEIGRQLSLNHRLEGRFLYEHDHSGTDRIGTIVDADDWDRTDGNLLWLGTRAVGDVVTTADTTLGYRLDGVIVTGEEDITDSIAGPGGGQRTVTGTRTRDVFGWAMDGGVDLALPTAPLSPTISLGYAYGSGDDNPNGRGSDNAFRQSGLHGNTSAFGGDAMDGRQRHYGEVLRPELSNIHILSLGAHIPVRQESGLSFTYFNYWLAEERGGLRSPGISAPLNGTDSYIGQAADMVLHAPLMDQISSRFIVGGFKAGDAYGAADDEYAWRGTAELRFKF